MMKLFVARRYFWLGLVACAALGQAQAQDTLPELVTRANAGWMFGKWEAQTDNGNPFNLDIHWDLDKHGVSFHGQGGTLEFKGYTVLDPESGQARYWGFDNHGVVTKGSWAMQDGQLLLRQESLVPNSNSRKMAFVFGGSADEGLQVQMYQIDDGGNLVKPARATFNFKRK